ncbi:MAG TPA: Na+/H+ antiporter NhaA [Burkholderiales bacterium]|nr:Na+/H+ antiporter NhaA [Burkholderiales bacterium]
MDRHRSVAPADRPRTLARRVVSALDHFLHVEAVSGIVLLVAAAAALTWANSPAGGGYEAFWGTPVVFGTADVTVSQSLRFWINDGLMVVFFLVVGMEIRRELHDGALADWRQASLPLAAALGGVAVPALIYLAIATGPVGSEGWAVPTATDIAFAVGVLALLGRTVPANVRVFLLTLAVIDDIVAVLIIALFYSTSFALGGALVAVVGVAMVFGMHRFGIESAFAYVLPGAVVWGGFILMGLHPTLAGVLLGLMTPPYPLRGGGIAPGARVEMALHPWVSYLVMPLFALANAGVGLDGTALTGGAHVVTLAVFIALVAGKPLGVVTATWLAVRLGGCSLPAGVTWGGIVLVGLLAGIGFTMSIFIAMLAFTDETVLGAAKLGVLAASLTAALLGLAWGALQRGRA